MKQILIIVTIYLIINVHTTLGRKLKRQVDRVCPTTNICGDGVCQVTTHPDYKFQYVCKCNDGTYKFEACKATTTAGKCSNQPCYPNVCIEAITSTSGYLCYCGGSDYRPSSCSSTIVTNGCNPSPCKNSGVCVSNADQSFKQCSCPFGTSGTYCENTATIPTTCSTLQCTSNGFCQTNANGNVYCACLVGFTGTRCEIATSSTSCSTLQCTNGVCQTDSTGKAYCNCKAGFTGTTCQTEYFKCTQNGTFKDIVGCALGKYLECVYYGQTQIGLPNGILFQRDCPVGLRFNAATSQCDYAINIQC